MVVLGIVLLLLGLAVGGYVVAGGLPVSERTEVAFSLLGLEVQTSAIVVFALGALTLLLLELGVLALRSGARASSKRRAELQRLRRVEAEVQARQAAESQRNASLAAPAPAPTPAPFARREPTTTGTTHLPQVGDTDRTGADRTSTDLSGTGIGRTGTDGPGTSAHATSTSHTSPATHTGDKADTATPAPRPAPVSDDENRPDRPQGT
jgi:hypothetical protein